MAEKTIIYIEREPQEIEGSLCFDTLYDLTTMHLCNLENLFKMHGENYETDVGVFARIAMDLFNRALKRIQEDHEVMAEHFGSVRLVNYTFDPENRELGRAGQFVGIAFRGGKKNNAVIELKEP